MQMEVVSKEVIRKVCAMVLQLKRTKMAIALKVVM